MHGGALLSSTSCAKTCLLVSAVGLCALASRPIVIVGLCLNKTGQDRRVLTHVCSVNCNSDGAASCLVMDPVHHGMMNHFGPWTGWH